MSKIERAIKQAILKSGRSNYGLSKETGISQALLSRVMNGTRGLGLEYAEQLAAALQLEIIIRPMKKTGRKTTKGK